MQAGSAKIIKLGVILVILGVFAVGVMLLPKGFKDDLSVIGQGSASVVLVHDKNLVGSGKLMEIMNKVRSDYEEEVNFLAVDVNTPIGQNFMREFGVGSIAVVFFGRDGSRNTEFERGIDEKELRLTLDKLISP
jgi:thioredoxin-like negative regulator of GroEL